MEKILKKFTYTVMAIAILFISLISFVCGGVGVTYAATSTSEVLADLRKDPDFDESAYPYVKDDYGLYVIQIAESSNKELFVYAYQPCNDTYDLKGTKISISYGYSVDGSGLTPHLYNLQLVSTDGTLDKYYVEGFTVPNDGDRYYNIVEIFRMINTEIDGEQDPTNPKTDKAYPVGQQWYVCDLNDNKHYEMNTFNTMFVETVLSSYITLQNGLDWGSFVGINGMCDCWIFCFNAEEYDIKHVFDADLIFSYRKVKDNYFDGIGHQYSYDEDDKYKNNIVTLKDIDTFSFSGSGLFANNFEWNRIMSSKKFISNAENQSVRFSDSVREKILSSQWVFSYYETERVISKPGVHVEHYTANYTDVYEVGLLRLHFQDFSGNYYDLGVVNDLTNPSDISAGVGVDALTEAFEKFWDMFVKIILALVGIALIALLFNFIGPVKVVLQYIFKAIGFVICAPFKLLKSIFKKD